MSNKVTVVLKTAKLSPTQKSTFAQHIHVSMLRNANFTAPYVALAILLAAITALNDAITAQTPGNKASTKLVKDKAYQLIRILKVLACYVEYISNDVAAVALTSGFSIRSTSAKTKAPLAAAHTGIVGEIELTAKAQTGAAYIYAYNATPANPATWVTAATSKKAKHVITGLTPGVAYGYRVALVTKAGQQAWSDVIVLIVL